MKWPACLTAALLLALPAPAASTNRVEFREVPLTEAARHLGATYGVNFVVPGSLADLICSLSLANATLEDVIAVMNLQFQADDLECGWVATRSQTGQAAYILESNAARRPPTPLAEAKGPGLTNVLVQMDFREASLDDVATYLSEKTGVRLIIPDSFRQISLTLDLRNVTLPDVITFLVRLIGAPCECKGLQLSTGAWVFALLPIPATPPPPVDGVVKVYYGGRTPEEFVVAMHTLRELLAAADLTKRAEVMAHNASRMIVVRGDAAVQAFVQNAMEEIRRGRELETTGAAGAAPAAAPAKP